MLAGVVKGAAMRWERPGTVRWERERRRGAVGSNAPSSAPEVSAEPALAALIDTYAAAYGAAWRPLTRLAYAADYRRFLEWLSATGRPATTASLDLLTLAAYVSYLRRQPVVSGVWRGSLDARGRSLARGGTALLSANSVNSYVRPLRSLCLWLLDEGLLSVNPFRRTHRRSGIHPLLPSEETPPKSATLADVQALERGCAGAEPLDLRDGAAVSVLKTTAARNSAVRLLRLEDVDLDHGVIRFRRGKGGKTLEVALHPETRAALLRYLAQGRPALVGEGSLDPGFLFPSANIERGLHPLTTNSLSLMLRRRYHRGGGTLPTFGAHRIRHATATLLVNAGMPIGEVSAYLGHSSIEVTRRYARFSTGALGLRAGEALARAGLVEAAR